MKWNVLPRPDSLSTQMRPPISSTSCGEMASPRPVPPYLRVVELSACANASKISSLLVGRDADAGVADGEVQRAPRRRLRLRSSTCDDDLALLGELDGVADQVDEDLPQPAGVADQRVGHVGRRRGRPAPAPSAWRRRASVCMVSPRLSRRSKSIGSSSSLPASILEKSRMSLITVSSASADVLTMLQVLALLGGEVGVERQLGHAEDAVHRRADLVAHVGQELALGPAGRLGRFLGLLQLLLGPLALGDVPEDRLRCRRLAAEVVDRRLQTWT